MSENQKRKLEKQRLKREAEEKARKEEEERIKQAKLKKQREKEVHEWRHKMVSMKGSIGEQEAMKSGGRVKSRGGGEGRDLGEL